ncbi:Trm112 family protein [Sphingosinicella sp. BN140058]|uniref:Trm112 family protein n=1 Tax=Sphingosinicella sp. BN140058 TaxID=1892855 RepID=UPI00101368E7|nr:Trm112 family protein [Sphingosinicella sp. BN140058]QAY76870.1 Trm112 family protein [Sphingosinicella sp. BN140058]
MSPDLIARLVCPVTRGRLRLNENKDFLISDAASLAYPIRDGVPVLIVEEARHLDEAS